MYCNEKKLNIVENSEIIMSLETLPTSKKLKRESVLSAFLILARIVVLEEGSHWVTPLF